MATENRSTERLAWSVRRLAAATDLSERYLWQKIADKTLPAMKIGSRTLVPDAEARRFFLGEVCDKNSI